MQSDDEKDSSVSMSKDVDDGTPTAKPKKVFKCKRVLPPTKTSQDQEVVKSSDERPVTQIKQVIYNTAEHKGLPKPKLVAKPPSASGDKPKNACQCEQCPPKLDELRTCNPQNPFENGRSNIPLYSNGKVIQED